MSRGILIVLVCTANVPEALQCFQQHRASINGLLTNFKLNHEGDDTEHQQQFRLSIHQADCPVMQHTVGTGLLKLCDDGFCRNPVSAK